MNRLSSAFAAPFILLAAGCLTSTVSSTAGDAGGHPATGNDSGTLGSDGGTPPDPSMAANHDAITYRDLASHPGCTTDGLSYPPAQIGAYRCAAKAYPLVVAEDTSKPIVIMLHGNSSTPGDWEVCTPGTGATSKCVPPSMSPPMLSERLVAAGVRAYAVDLRMDKTDDPTTNDPKTGNPAHNMSHGWAVPILEHMIESVIGAYPQRQLAIVGFSMGPTVIRDALRRLHRRGVKPFEHIHSLVLASGANHGVSSYRKKCGDPANPLNVTMAGTVACEMGDLVAFTLTPFLTSLNGTDGAWETPCSDGNTAYGQSNICGGHTVHYTTVVMQDPPMGALQDEFVSQKSSALLGADNKTVSLADQDQTGYFYNLFKNHYGAIRSEAGLGIIVTALIN